MIEFQKEGKGPLLVFLHGWAGTNRVWDKMVLRLGKKYACLRISINLGAAPAKEAYFDTLCKEIRSVLTKEERPLAFVAWSFGAVVLWELFRRNYPVPAAFIIASSGRYLKEQGNPNGVPPKEYRALKIQLKRDPQTALDQFLAGVRGEVQEKTDLNAFNLDELKVQLDLIGEYDVRDVAKKARFPIHFIHGSEDKTMPLKLGKDLAQLIQNSPPFYELEAGHGLPLTHTIQTALIVHHWCVKLMEKNTE